MWRHRKVACAQQQITTQPLHEGLLAFHERIDAQIGHVQAHATVDVGADRLGHDEVGCRRHHSADRHQMSRMEVRRGAHLAHLASLRVPDASEIHQLMERFGLQRELRWDQQLRAGNVVASGSMDPVAVIGGL